MPQTTITTLICPTCGAKLPVQANSGRVTCSYCGNQHILNIAPDQGNPAPMTAQAPAGVTFQRRMEPRESAFSLLVPTGWLMDGGIFRSNPMQGPLNAQAIEAKLDFTVKRDEAGSLLIRWCPEMKYCDMRMTPMGLMFPPGSNYAGMKVSPLLSPQQFLVQVVFPWAHPMASQVQVVAQDAMPALVERFRKRQAALGIPSQFAYSGGSVTFTYSEAGIPYVEKAYTVISNMGPMAAGMWSNTDTVYLRGPVKELEAWGPVLGRIIDSMKLNPQWVVQESQSQNMLAGAMLNAQQAAQARDRQVLQIQHQLQDMDRQIVEHRQRTNAEIQNDQYLNLTSQEEYINPYTNEPEVGSNQWKYRWVTDAGDEHYSDSPDEDPNAGGILNRTDWKRSEIRQRFPQ